MTTVIINKDRGTVTITSTGFCDSYRFVSIETKCIAGEMKYKVTGELNSTSNKVIMTFPAAMTNLIVIEEHCISNTINN